jgi:hypothetical protein
MADEPLKSAYELAMDRLRAKDKEAGVEEAKPLTGAQKEAIATLRQEAQAKLAELEILHRKARAALTYDPAKPDAASTLEERYATDRARVESRLESAIAKVKKGSN